MDNWIEKLAQEFQNRQEKTSTPISRTCVTRFVGNLVNFLYPSRNQTEYQSEMDWQLEILKVQRQLKALLKELDVVDFLTQTKTFIEALLPIKDTLDADAAFFESQDPAAKSVHEVVTCYPGFLSLIIHRIAHQLYKQGIPLLPRVISELAHEKTGVDIHPGATIASPVFIDHGTGIVIGETCVIGRGVKIFQGVTLGAHSVKRNLKGTKRHPTVGENVILYSNATILGGDTVIGDNSIIGGNVWITSSIPSHSQIYYSYKHQQQVRKLPNLENNSAKTVLRP